MLANISSSLRCTLIVFATTTILTACNGGSQSTFGPRASTVQPGVAATRSWISADARKKTLLYISDGSTNDVYVYGYPKGKLEGTLTGFNDPAGMCVDGKGDVFITENYGQAILEYAHGGGSPIATLSDPGWQPDGCSVDPKTGNIAVANIVTTSFTQGSLAVYPNASGSPTYYSPPGGSSGGWFSINAVGYDDKSNIFFSGSDGFEGGPPFLAGELPKGGSSTETISLNASLGNPGQVQWDGTYITFADANTGYVYRFTISGSSGTEVSSTTVDGCCSGGVYYSWIAGKTLIEPQTGENAYFYKYPAGGNPTKTISVSSGDGAVVSAARKK